MPHVVQLLDTFVHVGGRRPRHVLVTELAEHGSLTTFLPKHGAFPERKAKAQVLGIARATDLLHRMHAVHRDLTPNNIFVMGDLTLKLADFGIAKHIAYGRGVQNDAQNPAFVHHLMRVGGLRLWKRKQDVYQLGQLLAMLISGNPKRHASRDVAALRCSDHMKGIIQRSIGPETGRYPTAAEFVAALQSKPQALRHQRLAALRDAVVVFTGALSMTRTKAAALARRAGATVASSVTPGDDGPGARQAVQGLRRGQQGTQAAGVRAPARGRLQDSTHQRSHVPARREGEMTPTMRSWITGRPGRWRPSVSSRQSGSGEWCHRHSPRTRRSCGCRC